MSPEVNFMVGGEAGQGVQTVGFVLAKTMSRLGLSVFADQDYESRIRGGHNFFRIRASDGEVAALSEAVDILIAIDQNSIGLHRAEVRDNGVVIFDHDKVRVDFGRPASLGVPLDRLAEEKAGNKVMANSVAVGAAMAVGGYDLEAVKQVLREHFAHLGKAAIDGNLRAVEAGYDFTRAQGPQALRSPVASAHRYPGAMLLNGNEAMALGAMAAGCRFMAGYPMTPTSSIIEYMADKGRKFDVVVLQPEDEIAAMNMVVGAGYAGVRAMTATSGDGFALMTEALGLAGMTETPVVVVLGQRTGPAVGMPTRTEQGELLFAIHGGSGEFPRAVLAPCTIEDAFYSTVRAFNLAEKYQVPVIILTDHHLASSYQTVRKFDLKGVQIERGELITDEEAARLTDYKRHKITTSGISPRLVPLRGKSLVVTDADEHDEAGHMIEDGEKRNQMMGKRLRKISGLWQEIAQPRFLREPKAEITVVGWGSSFGALAEAAAMMKAEGTPISVLQLSEMWPFPAQSVAAALSGTRRTLVVENNATGQLAHLIRAETGILASGSILKFDGRPFSPTSLAKEIKKEVVPVW